MIKGLVSDEECEALRDLAASVEGLPVVEIGAYTGVSTCALASVATDVYSVDLWDLHLPGEKLEVARNKVKRKVPFNSTAAFSLYRRNLKEHGIMDRVTWIRGESSEVAKAWSRPIGGLFIDGAHDAKSVRADYDGWAGHVVPGGWIAFHDATAAKGVIHVLETVVKPSGDWHDWQVVHRLAFARRVEA